MKTLDKTLYMSPHHYYMIHGECCITNAAYLIKQKYNFYYEYDDGCLVFIDKEFVAFGYVDLYIIKREKWEEMKYLGFREMIKVLCL